MKSKYYTIILTLSLLCASCSDFLTEEPISDLIPAP